MSRRRTLGRIYRPRTLSRQTTLLFLVSLVPVLLLSGWFSYSYTRDALEAATRAQFTTRTEATRETLAEVILRTWERLETFAQSTNLQAGVPVPADDPARAAARQEYESATPGSPARRKYVDVPLNSALMAFNTRYPEQWAAILTADSKGILVGTSTPAWPYWDLSRLPWWSELTAGGPQGLGIARPVEVPGLGPLLLLNTPLRDANFQPNGWVVVGYSMAAMVDPILNVDGDPATRSLLVDKAGRILYTFPNDPSPQLPAAWQPLLAGTDAGARTIGPDLVGYAGVQAKDHLVMDRAGTIAALNRLGWSVLRVKPTAQVFAPLGGQLAILAAGSAATAFIIVLIASIAVRWLITRPLLKLRGIIMDVRRDGLTAVTAGSVAPPVHDPNEIGELAQLFTQMLWELADLTQQRQATAAALRETAQQLSTAAAEQQQITAGTNRMLDQVLATFQALDDAAVAIADHAHQVAAEAGELRSRHQAGEAALTTTHQALHDLQQTAAALEEGVRRLAATAGATGVLIGEANAIADTTNILSLNATIEAVGAGPHGARFSIIAEEVRLLAASASRTAHSIEDSLAQIAEQTLTAAAETHQAHLAVDSGAAQIDTLNALMQALLVSSEGLADNADGIRRRSEDQRRRSQEAHSSSDQLAGAMQQLTMSSGQVAGQAQELLGLALILDAPQPPAPDHSPAPAPDAPARNPRTSGRQRAAGRL